MRGGVPFVLIGRYASVGVFATLVLLPIAVMVATSLLTMVAAIMFTRYRVRWR